MCKIIVELSLSVVVIWKTTAIRMVKNCIVILNRFKIIEEYIKFHNKLKTKFLIKIYEFKIP